MLPCACSVAGDPCGTVGGGLTQAPAVPFRGRARVPPPQSCRGTRVAWHSLKVGWESRDVQVCRAPGPGVCACGRHVLPALPCWVQPLPPQPAWHQRWWQNGVEWQALPSPASCPLSALFQPNALYEIVILWEINHGRGATAQAGMGHASWQCLPPWECIYHGDFLRL